MIATQPRTAPPTGLSVVFVEVNEAERHFLERLVGEGKLPNLARMLQGGVIQRTRVRGFDPSVHRAWRLISPWIVWPSVYSGLEPAEHGIIGFGQDTSSIRGRCLWDVLDAHDVSVGVFGSLMSYPPRTQGHARYYVPEGLADDASCIPETARPVQEFCIFSARNYSESFSLKALEAARLLLCTLKSGVRPATVFKTLAQVPKEVIFGAARVPERAMLASYIAFDAFRALYSEHRPSFATLHMNHVAYMQHRYWRAAEPQHYRDELSATDQRFFRDVEARKRYEQGFAHWIERSFRYTDEVLGRVLELVDDKTIVLVGTGLGQRPFDPVHQIHNPVVRLVRERELFDALGLERYTVLHQMNPDVTINCQDEAAARAAEQAVGGLYVLEGEALFEVARRGKQVFVELNMPRREAGAELPPIRHRERAGFSAPFSRHIHEHPTADQSTAHHKDTGWLLAYSKGFQLEAAADTMYVTDVAPTVLSWFGVPIPPWMDAARAPAIRIAPRS
jgi:hypothetical protein